ncbi:MAG: type IV toxin-antitoxin system AbiEi family antitoxin [Terriglobia bacterium]
MARIMNTTGLVGLALEDALASKLRDFLKGISWLKDWQVEKAAVPIGNGFDLVAKLPVRGTAVSLCVNCKSDLRPNAFEALAQKHHPPSNSRQIAVPVLAMPFVSPRLADLCLQHGWGWYDLAGNCHIEAPGLIFLERRGQVPVHRPPRPKANLSSPEAGRVVRALLVPEHAGWRWTQRMVQEHFGEMESVKIQKPSLGLVNKVIRFLRDEAFIEVSDERGFRVGDSLKLFYAWRDAYRFERHERRSYFTLLRGNQLNEALYRLDLDAGGRAAYAAFSAADLQAPHVRQPKAWIYVAREYVARFEALISAKSVDSGENLEVLVPDDEGVFYLGERKTPSRMGCTNPVQTCIDLFHCGGRGTEAAEALLAQRLRPVWESSQK